MILAIDPSSTCVGYALLRGMARGDLIEAGRLKPPTPKASIPAMAPWLAEHMQQPELRAARRVAGLMRDAVDLLTEYQPQRVVIEIPSGLMGTGAKGKINKHGQRTSGARGSLTTYGMAAGAIWAVMDLTAPGIVAPVTERQWTVDRGNKYEAQLGIAALYPSYSIKADPGADVSDAIGLGRWWLTQHYLAKSTIAV